VIFIAVLPTYFSQWTTPLNKSFDKKKSSLLGNLPDVDHNVGVTSVLGFHQLKSGLALRNPPKKTHPKKPT
jgi:hypothetical protein